MLTARLETEFDEKGEKEGNSGVNFLVFVSFAIPYISCGTRYIALVRMYRTSRRI